MSQSAASQLNDLIGVLGDGVKFYEDAARTVDGPYQALFQRLASTKRAILSDLRAEVAYHGEAPFEGGTLAGSLRQAYTDLSARFSGKPDAKYISQLEETEDRILRAFTDALTTSERAEVRQVARNYLPDIKRMHEEMRALKAQVQHAA
jgi:uncharacterized protein (TIGR02284 family)